MDSLDGVRELIGGVLAVCNNEGLRAAGREAHVAAVLIERNSEVHVLGQFQNVHLGDIIDALERMILRCGGDVGGVGGESATPYSPHAQAADE